ncbi:hypothetical protein [Bifidobacterium oedipodis]|uniref:PhnA protein n=1 Tax=Bifidobacterium oedipodis TaxID=2675322 RepID=A0A7Y0ENE3_9BIFI|nr:hypothetical protein [Bifidobacterium sp. DSM 109957]NMM93459.1 PhnA protein [Bifidobacterium sp. DSM 109957]
MTGPCVNNDGARTATGRLLCGDCEQRLLNSLTAIGEDATPLLMIATKRASVSMQGNGHAAPVQSPSPLRDGMWELYCETERLLRQLGLRFNYAKAVDPRATVAALAGAVISDPEPLLSSGDVLAWYEDITGIADRIRTAVNPARPRIAFGACPECGSVVWGDPDEQYGECAGCGSRVNRRAVSDRLLARLVVSEVRGTPTQLSAECAKAGIRLPASTIRSWVKRGRLRYDDDGKLSLSELVPLLDERRR